MNNYNKYVGWVSARANPTYPIVASGFINWARRTSKYRFPAIVTWLIHQRALQRVNFPRKRFRAISKIVKITRIASHDRH